MDELIEPIMKAIMKVFEWTLTLILLLTIGTARFFVRKVREMRSGSSVS